MRVKEGKNVSSDNVGGHVGNSDRVKKDTGAKLDGVVGCARESMPEWPPATGGIRKRLVIGMLAKEVAVVLSVGETSKGRRDWG
jgi:hypothetical protein